MTSAGPSRRWQPQSGASIFALRDLLGHRTLTMVNRYARRAATAAEALQTENAEPHGRAIMDGTEADDSRPAPPRLTDSHLTAPIGAPGLALGGFDSFTTVALSC